LFIFQGNILGFSIRSTKNVFTKICFKGNKQYLLEYTFFSFSLLLFFFLQKYLEKSMILAQF